jgi:hypothetical protein
MDSNNFTDREMLIQWLDEHWTDVLKYYGAKMKNATEVEKMAFDDDKVVGVLCSFVYEGVRKVVNVTPMSLVEGLTSLSEELAIRCEKAATSAEQQGSYAERQGDRVNDAILDITEQKELATRMANYAKEQGDHIVDLKDMVTEWFGATPNEGIRKSVSDWRSDTQLAWSQWWDGIKDDWSNWFNGRKDQWTSWYNNIVSEVDGWFSVVKQEWTTWFNERKNEWNVWYAATTEGWDSWFEFTKLAWSTWFNGRKDEWTTWLAGIKNEWSSWFSSTKDGWNTWFSELKSTWSSWFSQKESDWSTWFNGRKDEWTEWKSGVVQIFSGWEQKEQERQSAEEIRLEIQAHPPIPSERGYWMFWDVNTHEYVESGYSSRGTMDWPEFFWDYDTMGVGVITTRDYSRFFIDEQGRFGMYM